MAYGLMGLADSVENRSRGGLRQAADFEQQRNRMNDQIDAADSAQKKSTAATVAGLGLDKALTSYYSGAETAATAAKATEGAATTAEIAASLEGGAAVAETAATTAEIAAALEGTAAAGATTAAAGGTTAAVTGGATVAGGATAAGGATTAGLALGPVGWTALAGLALYSFL